MFSNALPGLTDELKQVSQEMEVLLPKEWNRGEVGSIIQAVLAGRGKGYRPSLLLGVLDPIIRNVKNDFIVWEHWWN